MRQNGLEENKEATRETESEKHRYRWIERRV